MQIFGDALSLFLGAHLHLLSCSGKLPVAQAQVSIEINNSAENKSGKKNRQRCHYRQCYMPQLEGHLCHHNQHCSAAKSK